MQAQLPMTAVRIGRAAEFNVSLVLVKDVFWELLGESFEFFS